ncbi:hypothetical protein AX16_007643 [Volvariella volvacea WC 439]|nr:hypothetical protein AX16_007643 [Volvariella volvacea WC 439]
MFRVPITSLRQAPISLRVLASSRTAQPALKNRACLTTFRPLNATNGPSSAKAAGGSRPNNDIAQELTELLREMRTTNVQVKELPGDLRADLRQLASDMAGDVDRLTAELKSTKEESERTARYFQGVIGLFGLGMLLTAWMLLGEFKIVEANLLMLGRMEDKNAEALRSLASGHKSSEGSITV